MKRSDLPFVIGVTLFVAHIAALIFVPAFREWAWEIVVARLGCMF